MSIDQMNLQLCVFFFNVFLQRNKSLRCDKVSLCLFMILTRSNHPAFFGFLFSNSFSDIFGHMIVECNRGCVLIKVCKYVLSCIQHKVQGRRHTLILGHYLSMCSSFILFCFSIVLIDRKIKQLCCLVMFLRICLYTT